MNISEAKIPKKINILSKETADKIAAGEVIERPLCVIKELVENSVDSGAHSITVEIEKGGRDYIRVTDDGCGIMQSDVDAAFMRYSTSKIIVARDLDSVRTLGFRGEALASIAACSRTEMITKTVQEDVGSRIVIEGGEVIGKKSAAAEEGTTVIVRDLFYNTPARREFLKSDAVESSLISEFLSRMAIAYPDIRLRFINGGKIKFSTPGSGDLLNAIALIHGSRIARCLVEVQGADEEKGYGISGFVSSPGYSRANRALQNSFVNGRYVKNRTMESAIADAYSDRLFSGEFPAVFLFLTIPPEKEDVNIHPKKTDIRFHDESAIREFVRDALRESLLTRSGIPIVGSEILKKSSTERPTAAEKQDASESGLKTESEDTGTEGSDIETKKRIPDAWKSISFSPETSESAVRFGRKQGLLEVQADFFKALRAEREAGHFEEEGMNYGPEEGRLRALSPERFKFSGLSVLGAVFASYIIATDENNIYFIDQHAAHERIIFETLMAASESELPASQILLTPSILSLSPAEAEVAAERIEILTSLGYDIEEFGHGDYIMKAMPACFDFSEGETFALEAFEKKPEDDRMDIPLKEAIIMRSCKAAVKGGDRLSEDEMKALLISLDKSENPFNCPHGRPTFLRLSKNDMEKLIKRR